MMEKYQVNRLKKYIERTKLIVVNEDLRIRLSEELSKKYNQGLYDNGIDIMLDYIKQINDLGIKYPANAKPIFYIYVVPDDSFRELLNFPTDTTSSKKSGGKSVSCYDLDGFNTAYGMSNNSIENRKEHSMKQTVNNIHEFAHLVYSMFSSNSQKLLAEGFAEALPFYTMDYESTFGEHREILRTLTEEQVLSAQQLIELTYGNNFDIDDTTLSKFCSFRISYISSYLFVRGCLEKIANKFGLDRAQATQRFLEIIRESQYTNQWLIFDIANAIGAEQEELLGGKEMQLKLIESLTRNE